MTDMWGGGRRCEGAAVLIGPEGLVESNVQPG